MGRRRNQSPGPGPDEGWLDSVPFIGQWPSLDDEDETARYLDSDEFLWEAVHEIRRGPAGGAWREKHGVPERFRTSEQAAFHTRLAQALGERLLRFLRPEGISR